MIGKIGDEYVLRLPFVGITVEENAVKLSDPFLSNKIAFIPAALFTSELIAKICSYHPRALMGGEIKDHQQKDVPKLIDELKRYFPDVHAAFIAAYPQFDREINYAGRNAKLKTISPGPVLFRDPRSPSINADWEWDGEELIYRGGYVGMLGHLQDYEITELRVKPGDGTTIKITDNAQVTETTVFVD